MLPQLLNIIGGTKCAVFMQQLRKRPGQQAGTRDDADRTEYQCRVRCQVEILARQRGEDQRRCEHVDVDAIDPRHVGPSRRVDVASRMMLNTGRMMSTRWNNVARLEYMYWTSFRP